MVRKSSLIVVLGMHRSGSSVVSRALKVLGVELGDNLIGPDKNNPKGYWEDLDISRLNNEMLGFLKMDWHSLSPIEESHLESLNRNGFSLRAAELLRNKMGGFAAFGFKDPRTAKLLAFWKGVFSQGGFRAQYILVSRNPLSVCHSLAERDGFDFEKSYLLWLEHVINSINLTDNENRVFVDFDALVSSPDKVLARVGNELRLQINERELAIYREEFLDPNLRHSVFQFGDLEYRTETPPLVTEVFEYLQKLVLDQVQSLELIKRAEHWHKELYRFKPALVLADKSEEKRKEYRIRLRKVFEEIAEYEKQIKLLSAQLSMANMQLEQLKLSAPYRLLILYRRVLDLVFRPGTRIRRFFDLFAKSVKSFIFGGPRAFWRNSTEWWVLRNRRRQIVGQSPPQRAYRRMADEGEYRSGTDEGEYAQVYRQALIHAANQYGPDYVPFTERDYSKQASRIRAIAFYLPQFHPIPENDKWWGKGFTEWTNVSKAIPQFVGHYQPHLPSELGFYDLRVPEVLRRQVELARKYGIYGFCFYYYWFAGKRLLERPLEQYLSDKKIDFPYCICWANENWTRRWDGQDREILIPQKHSAESDLAFIKEVAPLFRDDRYIRIDGKPMLIVYRANILPDAKVTVNRWRDYCRANGLGDVYLVAAQTFGFSDPTSVGFDAAVEFPPHGLGGSHISPVNIINPEFSGQVLDYASVVANSSGLMPSKFTLFRTVMPGWDNTPRRGARGGLIFHGNSPALYRIWLSNCIEYTSNNYSSDKQYVFINAWNEWAEGAHLEPDRKYGYAFLQQTAEALTESQQEMSEDSREPTRLS
jgi:hypothetical protein